MSECTYSTACLFSHIFLLLCVCTGALGLDGGGIRVYRAQKNIRMNGCGFLEGAPRECLQGQDSWAKPLELECTHFRPECKFINCVSNRWPHTSKMISVPSFFSPRFTCCCHDLRWTLCLCMCVCVRVFSFNASVMIPHESLLLVFRRRWPRTYCNGGEMFVTEHVHVVFAQKCVSVHAIQISFWSLRKPEINRSQSVFRRLDRQFCFKTSKHHLYSTFRAHKCLSDIYERQSERKSGERLAKEKRKKLKKSRREEERTGLFLTSVKDLERHTKTDGRTESDGAGDISSVSLIG